MSATLALVPKPPTAAERKLGFAYWMDRVLEECDRAIPDLAADPVHDLRVALRRCRSMADGFRTMDPDPAWRRMKKAGGVVFKALGDLRDVQVMRAWLERLHPEPDVLGKILDQTLADRERALQQEALGTLRRFDHEEWREWAAHMAKRAARVRLGGPAFQYLALERMSEAQELQGRALRNRSKTSWHQLRIGIKRFRYTVENFLPQQHEAWGGDLKALQDALGEVHDFDVLWDLIRSYGFDDAEMVGHWRERIERERAERIASYRQRMVGAESQWRVWRGQLPAGEQLGRALRAKLETFAGFSHGAPAHARRVAAVARRLYGELLRSDVLPPSCRDLQAKLVAAALLLDIGKHRHKAVHHKQSARMAAELPVPLGWAAEDWQLVVAAIRYHAGALPEPDQRAFRRVAAKQRRQVFLLSGILRLASVLSKEQQPRIDAERTPETVRVLIRSIESTANATELSLARSLLESGCGVPVVIRFVAAPVRETKRVKGSFAALRMTT